jgi:hypothetical protein
MKVEGATAPAALCGHKWHPTQAVITIDGKNYSWDARAHRKLRHPCAQQADEHPEKFFDRFNLFSWEPHIVTWYNIYIGEIANTLWVVNGLYATWPDQAKGERAEMISYVTGTIGAFLFIVTGYLGYIETINQTYAAVRLPTDSGGAVRQGPRDEFNRPDPILGEYPSPIGHGKHGKHTQGTSDSLEEQVRLLEMGYPLVQDVSTKQLVTSGFLNQYMKEHSPQEAEEAVIGGDFAQEAEEAVIGRDFDILLGGHAIRVCAKSVAKTSLGDETNKIQSHPVSTSQGYCWWTLQPDLTYISIVTALVFFVATVSVSSSVNHCKKVTLSFAYF